MRKALFLAASIVSASLATATFAQSNSGSAGGAPSGSSPSAAAPSASPNASQSTSPHHRLRARHRARAGGMRNAQQALKSQGLYQGNIDGKYGPLTKQALMQFQQQNHLKQTGRLDRETRVALRGGASQSGGAGMNGASGGSPPNATSANPNNNADARTAPSGSSMVPPGAGVPPKPNPGATQPAQ